MTRLFCFGLGYSAKALGQLLAPSGWRIAGTATSPVGVANLKHQGFDGYLFDGTSGAPAIADALRDTTHILLSVPPDSEGDPVLRIFSGALAAAPRLEWIGYLSTIGVYGDHGGAWVDETTPATPGSDRSRRRVEAENAWLQFGAKTGRRVQIFRLAGIYGPGRSAIDNVRENSARRIIKPGQVFNRTHVADIASVLDAATSRTSPHTIFNVTDDEPAPPQDVIAFAAGLLGYPVPPGINFDVATFSSIGRSFYSENKRVRNERIKSALGVTLLYPTYREGLAALAGDPAKFREDSGGSSN